MSPSLVTRVQYQIEYWLVAGLAGFCYLLPRRVAMGIGAALGQFGWWCRMRRKLVLTNLRQALPDISESSRVEIGADSARNFGRTLIDFLRFSRGDVQSSSQIVELEGLDILQKALDEGRGAIVVTAHLGAWVLYVSAVAQAKIPMAMLIGVQRNLKVDAMTRGIVGNDLEFISKAKSSPRRILKALKAGKAVVMVADHYSSEQSLKVPFLGREAYTLPLPGALVERLNPCLLSLTGVRKSGGQHQATIRRIEVPQLEDRAGIREQVGRLCNEALGRAILENPRQYFWYHNRWKARQYDRETS